MKYVVLSQDQLDHVCDWAKQSPHQALSLLWRYVFDIIKISGPPKHEDYTVPRPQIDRIEGAMQEARDSYGNYIWDIFCFVWANRRPGIMENADMGMIEVDACFPHCIDRMMDNVRDDRVPYNGESIECD